MTVSMLLFPVSAAALVTSTGGKGSEDSGYFLTFTIGPTAVQ